MVEKKDNRNIIIVGVVIVIMVLLFLGYNWLLEKGNNENSSNEKMCVEQCNLNQNACLDMLRVMGEGTYELCSTELTSCVDTCLS